MREWTGSVQVVFILHLLELPFPPKLFSSLPLTTVNELQIRRCLQSLYTIARFGISQSNNIIIIFSGSTYVVAFDFV